MGKLVLYMPDGSTRDIRLAKERVTIGRRPDNDIALPYPAVSAEHAAIVTVLADSFLEDLGSTNGTFVNDRSVTKHYLRDRDRLDIGREILVYYSDDDAESEPLPPELLEHDRGSILEPLDAHLSALSDMAKSRSSRGPRGTEHRPVVAEFDPASTSPMTGQIATEFDSVTDGGDGPDLGADTEQTRPVAARVDDTSPRPRLAADAAEPPFAGRLPRARTGRDAGSGAGWAERGPGDRLLQTRDAASVGSGCRWRRCAGPGDRIDLLPVEGAPPTVPQRDAGASRGRRDPPWRHVRGCRHHALARPQISGVLLPLFGECDAGRHPRSGFIPWLSKADWLPFVARKIAIIRLRKWDSFPKPFADQILG